MEKGRKARPLITGSIRDANFEEIRIRPRFLSGRFLSRKEGLLLKKLAARTKRSKAENKLFYDLALTREETASRIRACLLCTLSVCKAAEPFPRGWLSYAGLRKVNDELLYRISARSQQPPKWVEPGDWRSFYQGRYYCFTGTIMVRENRWYSTTLECDDLCSIFTRRESMGYTITDAILNVQDQIEMGLGIGYLCDLPSPSPTNIGSIIDVLEKEKQENRFEEVDKFCNDEDSMEETFLLFVPVHLFHDPEFYRLQQEKWRAEYTSAQVQDGPFPLPPVDGLVSYMLKSKVKAFVASLDVRAEHDRHHWKLLKDFVRPRYDTELCSARD